MIEISDIKGMKRITELGCTKSNQEIDRYISNQSLRLSKAQDWLLKKTMHEPRAPMLVSSLEMQLLSNICYAINAKKTLDIGVYTGYSSLTIAEVLPPDGRVLALDITDIYLENYCKPAWRQAGVESKIDFRLGPAIDTLENLVASGECETFDFAFIDADKENYSNYYELCVKLIRPRGIIAIDNVLWSKRVIDDSDQHSSTIGIRRLNDLIAGDRRVRVSLLNIGDGLTVVVKQ